MARIRRSDTKPEWTVRRLLHELGYRYRTQLAAVPGRPDIAFTARRKCIQVHGCFWHAHGCDLSRSPKTRTAFWEEKFARNRERDARLDLAATALGWSKLVVWECETRNGLLLGERLIRFLGERRHRGSADDYGALLPVAST
ncbi:very short patch repair endonuclease [Glacieibacterium megasporae]|uniref:very short patch repair endonuclease n=1 Tax=Glacieibacterium megasporae TaxID=2835787 RepID=UPI001C1E42C3|nr:very short patch repair endonuclease [Polymorphobacter megasporae]UAJ11944.1 very short patch repair endonuclease [Polymorphobacter megasporae]